MSSNTDMTTVCGVLQAVVTGGKGYGISHCWNGTVLEVTSDSGTSSADLAGAAGKQTLVTVTGNDTDGFAADMTFAEVTAAIEAGDAVAAKWEEDASAAFFHLMGCDATMVMFQMDWMGQQSELLALAADDTVTHIVFAYKDEGESSVTSVSVTKTDSTVTVTAVYDGGDSVDTVITLDAEGYPVSVERDGVTTTLTWEGFDG